MTTAPASQQPGNQPRPQLDPERDLIEQLTPNKAMVVMAHPDDCEFTVGGTVALLCSKGWEVDIVVATSGNKGTKDPEVTPQQLAGMREEEQRRASTILGANDPVFFGFGDGELVDDDELRALIMRQIRLRRPELVLTFDGVQPVTNHRDHRRIGISTYDAIYPAAYDLLYEPNQLREEGLLPHRPAAILFAGSASPDYHVDIEPVLRTKVQGLLAHSSQMRGRTEKGLLEMWRNRARLRMQDDDDGDGRDPVFREYFRRQILRR
ncbi:MAG: PIG-L deacetylase family protein [Dehalococcoidia bacterium]